MEKRKRDLEKRKGGQIHHRPSSLAGCKTFLGSSITSNELKTVWEYSGVGVGWEWGWGKGNSWKRLTTFHYWLELGVGGSKAENKQMQRKVSSLWARKDEKSPLWRLRNLKHGRQWNTTPSVWRKDDFLTTAGLQYSSLPMTRIEGDDVYSRGLSLIGKINPQFIHLSA